MRRDFRSSNIQYLLLLVGTTISIIHWKTMTEQVTPGLSVKGKAMEGGREQESSGLLINTFTVGGSGIAAT